MKLNTIKILLVEDNPGDARLVKEMLSEEHQVKYILTHVMTLLLAREFLLHNIPDVVLLDLSLPDGQGLESATPLMDSFREIPFVILTGLDDESIGLESIRKGAQDYLIKGQINSKLIVRVISYSIERKHSEQEKEKLIRELQELFSQVKRLRGLLPMCSQCKKIRDDNGNWIILETYIQDNSNTNISNVICPECASGS